MPKLLFLGQYPLDNINSAPKVRTYNFYQNFKDLVDTDFITGTRRSRRLPLLKYIFSGKLFKVDFIYLESATSTSMETDILLLLIAKFFRIPIGIYIRDAFPIFNLIEQNTIKNKLMVIGWYISIWVYKLMASRLFFPTDSLAKAFRNIKKYKLLPPGGISRSYEDIIPEHKGILYSGGLSPIYDINLLIKSIEKVYRKHNTMKLYFICRENEINQEIKNLIFDKPWIEIKHYNIDEIYELRNKIYLSIIPLAALPYGDVAIPVKLFDYMSLGRPIIATDRKETTIFFEENIVGLICKTNFEDMANKIEYLFDNYDLAVKLGKNAYNVLNEKHLWKHRAEEVIRILTEI